MPSPPLADPYLGAPPDGGVRTSGTRAKWSQVRATAGGTTTASLSLRTSTLDSGCPRGVRIELIRLDHADTVVL